MKFLPRLIAATALPTVAVLAFAGPAAAATTVDPAGAASWLAGALTDGNHVVSGGFAYDGASADALYALVAGGGHDSTVAAIDSYLQSDVAVYADPKGTGDFPGPYSGGLAKLALAAEITRGDPHAYGGFDLLGTLTASECTAAGVAKADGTCNAVGEFYQSFSTISQALGIVALQRSPVASDHLTIASAPVQRLLALKCTDGLYTGTLLAAGTTCATGDIDSTAYAAQAFAAVLGDGDPGTVREALLAINTAVVAGGFQGASGVNANTAGVALSAVSLEPGSWSETESNGAALLATLQRPDGAIRVSTADSTDDSAIIATPQALLGALGRHLNDPTLITPAPVVTTPPAPTDSASPTPTATGSGQQLANTGVGGGHVPTELALALGALGVGGVLVRIGARRLGVARHRA